jgi:hypothetical protein
MRPVPAEMLKHRRAGAERLHMSDSSACLPELRDAVLTALGALGGEGRIDEVRTWVIARCAFVSEATGLDDPRVLDRELLRALTALRGERLVDDLPCAHWALACRAEDAAVPATDDTVADARLAELRAMPFAEYLQTPEWLRTRAAALERAGERCAVEERHRTHLDVHHRSRERLGAEEDSDLVVLCRSCRVLYHRAFGITRHDEQAADAGAPAAVEPDRAPWRRLLQAHPFMARATHR